MEPLVYPLFQKYFLITNFNGLTLSSFPLIFLGLLYLTIAGAIDSHGEKSETFVGVTLSGIFSKPIARGGAWMLGTGILTLCFGPVPFVVAVSYGLVRLLIYVAPDVFALVVRGARVAFARKL